VTTVLLVDSHGRSSFGRFLSVKPDLGLITSTARTFIQEGVTTEYATQVLGTTLDNGRLYAHLLTKSSRVLYDGDSPSKSFDVNKKWNLDHNLINTKNFVRNTDFIAPTQVDPVLVFPTTNPKLYAETKPQEVSAEEILEEEPSNNPRVPYEDTIKKEVVPLQNNVKIFKINPQVRDLTNDNFIIHKENAKPVIASIIPSKVRPWDNLPTFTVRNEFSPSGVSYLGDFPEFDANTEKTRATTVAERKAKLLFRAGLIKPEPKDFQTITYSGFADFTTTVGDTVIVFSPHTTEVPKNVGQVTKISVQPTIRPSVTLQSPTITSTIKTFLSQEPAMETQTIEGHKLEMKSSLPTMVIDKTDRQRRPKEDVTDVPEDMEAKSAVLAHEQQAEDSTEIVSTSSGKSTIIFTPDVIEPSESQTPMLSTPSDEDIAKIFASLQAQAKLATQPLNTPSTVFFEESSTVVKSPATEISKTTPELVSNEIDTEKIPELGAEVDVVCTEGSQILPTTVYKTLTYLTTFFIPQDDDSTSISIKSNEVVSTEIGFQTQACSDIAPSSVITESVEPTITTTTEEEKTTTQELPKTTTELHDETTEHLTTVTEALTTTPALETTPQEITTERRHVTESEPETTEMTTESGEEIELIFKTLYTTYTYLTTYFQDTTSSIASKIVVTTNVITSTLIPGSEASDSAVAGLFEREDSLVSGYKSRTVSFEDIAEIAPTKIVQDLLPTLAYEPADEDTKATPLLNDVKIQQNGVKTYYTTYTYFTTIFVDGETEISSRTEVYTNYVTPSIQATVSLEDIVPTRVPSLFEHKNQVEAPSTEDEDDTDEETEVKKFSLNVTPLNTYNSTINRHKTTIVEDETTKPIDIYASIKDKLDNNILATSVNKEQAYVTLQRGTTTEDAPIENNLLNVNEYETIATMVTDVRSSTSEGDRRIIDNVDKRNVLDDQIVSESNNDSEIIPSPTLLLQTSYTTFTYFTTMYHGTTSSNVVSRLETVTNVVTETLTPTHTLSVEDLSLPITYFTTFTYWTTLYKDGTTKTTSREETVSNVVTPTPSLTDLPTISITSTETSSAEEVQPTQTIQPSIVGDDDLTTYFTTYTYYTTSYIGDSTVLNSRLETVTNVLNNSDIDSNQIGRAIGTASQNQLEDAKTKELESSSTIKPTGLLSTIVNTIENSGTTTILSTDIFGTYIDGLYAKVLESTSSIITPTIAPSSVEQNLKPTGVVSINQGKIVDAEGVSTLYYTTQAVGTYIDNLYAQVIESTSSLEVNEERKAALATDVPISHRTGLVRLIEGSIIQNETTTLYQSKVLGTVIDGRYAQIIESTSSFLVGKASSVAPSPVSEIVPSPTKAPDQEIAPTAVPISPSPVVIEGSLSDSSKIDEETSTEESEEDDEDDKDDGNSRVKSRLTFQTRKRTFTPVIRPFVSRPRPTFAPKRKGTGQGATTVTRSDVTPTVTAVPASKPARFGNRRASSSANNIVPTASGSRRFSRPKSSSAVGGASSAFGGGRRSSSRIQPTATGFGASSRRGGFRSSVGGSSQRASSLYAGNSRFRIRPTLASALNRSPASATPSSVDDENDLTTVVTDSTDTFEDGNETTLPLQTTTEGTSRRSQNPLLRFRRPPIARTTPRPQKSKAKSKTTTTTPKPKTTFNRPSAIARPRTNSLFPRRNLFTTTTTPSPEEDDEEDLEEESDNEDEDTDYDSSQTDTQTEQAPIQETRRGRSSNIQIKPFIGFRKRSRRQVNYSRFRRPPSSRTTSPAPVKEEPETEAPKPRSKPGRFSPRSRGAKTTHGTTSAPPTRKRISPTKASTQGRSQFTLREKDSNSRSNFRRPSSGSRPRTTVSSRPKSPRLRTTAQPESVRKPTRTAARRRTTSRQRTSSQEQIDDNFVIPPFDGTITITHQIPTEVTIPVVNGKITEYKNVITAKYSTEVLAPKQYSTSLNAFGKDVTVLLSEATTVADNGATFITQFVLNETPTTSVIFTPTYIRGRKTSFSHIIPSTAYGVEQVVNTIQPALAAQAPLANILLSQLLLGQNPLLPYQNPAVAATPTTEFKTRATTYVTTVTSVTSTVIPLTFRGKEILTTIIDSSVSVVTATEFLTDTVVVTPTLGFPAAAPQLNTLLLPLLQQQLAQQPSPLLQNQQPAGVFNFNNQPQAQALYQEPDKFNLESEEDKSDEVDQAISDEVTQASRRKSSRGGKRKPKPAPTEPPKETSVITLYVSGRIPGEFSTVLSTVIVDGNTRKKRDANPEVKPSKGYDDLVVSTLDYYDTYVTPATKEFNLDTTETVATESLESIIGDVSKHITTQTANLFNTKPTKSTNPSSKNVVDLDEKAPLMPKVETSQIVWGDNLNTNQNNHYVSKQIGKEFRFKRDVGDKEVPKPKRRVVKKLVRVQPVSHDNDIEVTTRRPRRRIVIKKKKRKLRKHPEDNIQQATKRRRKVVSRLRTYTYVITRVNGDEQIVTSTTEVKPQTKTSILTEPLTKYTTLTLLDFDDTSTLNPLPMTPYPESSQLKNTDKVEQGRAFEEARYNLATRIMSNGVEVIVAGDKSTLPGEPDVKRVLPSTIYKPVTLKPSTLSDHMMMMLPQDASNFVTKTCLTTFTYLTTYLESGTTAVSSHEQVVSNIATEERNTGKILPTPAMGITLTQYPNLSVGVFHTTYTYLNTILDGEQPLVVTSKHTVTNTVTAPDDYLSLLQPSENVSVLKDTNTYYSTLSLTKTLYEGEKSQVVSTNEVVTQVVITESIPPKATSVMTSYVALDVEDPVSVNYTTTDVVKTYFVTYTYYNTLVENGHTTVKTNVSTSSDVVTEKLYVHPRRTAIKDEKKKQKFDLSEENFHILATKTYHTTFTYFTTLLQEGNTASPTVISSHSKIVKNIVTETIDPSLLDKKYLSGIKSEIKDGSETITKLATLNDGQKLEITIIANEISPTKVLPIEKTKMPETTETKIEIESSTPSVIVGSTIIFLDDEPPTKTPSLTSSKILKKTKTVTSTSKLRRSTKTKAKTQTATPRPTKAAEKKPSTKVANPTNQVSDLLGLGSININSLQALTPVLNAMAGLIQTNLKANRRNDSIAPPTTLKPNIEDPNLQNRSPIYIPVGGLADEFEVAESQNIATFHLQETIDWDGRKDLKPTHGSPLLNGGIPISPGDVITANSDVIVGKPGRIGPRIPSIPLNQVKDDGYGMKPPPISQNKWPKRNHEYKHIPVAADKPAIHTSNKDDYVGPPPPLRVEKHKHIPLNRPVEQVYAQSQNNYGISYGINEVNHEIKIPNIREEIQKNYEQAAKNTFPIYAEGQSLNPVKNYNLQPPMVERSSGQPLLVNIQPSQVAFVNIPHNRTTDLNHVGAPEPHRNGQFFDDPSPYPEPEFSGIESFNNGIPQFASVYHDSSPSSQKQVIGVIKVAPQSSDKQQIPLNINPSRPNLINYQNQEVNINVPPISFGMIHQDNDFNAHVINHGQTQFRPPPISHEVIKNQENGFLEGFDIGTVGGPERRPENFGYLGRPQANEEIVDLRPPSGLSVQPHVDQIVNLKPPTDKPFNKVKPPPKRNFVRPRPKPNLGISEYMTPPPFNPSRHTTKPQYQPRPQKPVPIPLIPEHEQNIPNDSLYSEDDDDDLTSEDGEVVQESNSRPLRLGQIPFEILKIKTTTQTPIRNDSSGGILIDFPEINIHPRPVVSLPRPFGEVPLVRPENQQTNQINHFDPEQFNYITSRPDSGFITYIGSITTRPLELDIKPSTENNFIYHRRPTTTVRPLTTRKPVYHNASLYNTFAMKTRRPIPVYLPTTTPKPYVHEIIANRPKVTSLPIDRPTRAPEIIKPFGGSQTEKPFKTSRPLSITDLLKREKVTTAPTSTVKEVVTPELNEGEIPMIESEMEIMKPPPRVPDINMQPPKIEVNSPGGNIHRVPNLEQKHPDLEAHASSPMPYIPKPVENIVPPPPSSISDEVVGMSPPPLVSTHKPITSIDTTTIKIPFYQEIQTTTSTETSTVRRTRPSRRPFTRRTSTTRASTRRPLRPNYDIYDRNRTTLEPVVEQSYTISPSPTSISTPSMEVIIGNPNQSPVLTTPIEISSSEIEFKETTTESTDLLEDKPSTVVEIAKTTTKPHIEVSSKKDIINTAVHHAGNEIKIVDDNSSDSGITTATITTTKTLLVPTTKESKIIVPTRYITHTKTSTVTITKTTVVKTLGGPPSTLTLLVTKTEKSTVVDTVTEFHTLVKPTSIVETVTTTVSTATSLYPPDVYSSSYPSIKLRPSSSTSSIVLPTITVEESDEDLEDFIIKETDPPLLQEEASNDNDSIFVVMTDTNEGSVIKVPNNSYETQDRDEVTNNEVNNVLLGGIFIASPPSLEVPRLQTDKCEPECKASRNELCQKVEGIMRCVCRPGFARMFPDRPCIRKYHPQSSTPPTVNFTATYTYNLKVNLDRFGRDNLQFSPDLANPNSTEFRRLTALTHEALDRMVMQSDLRDIYHGVHVHSYGPRKTPLGVTTKFYLQLSDNTDEQRLEDVFKKYLRNNNYSLGGTEIFASREGLEELRARDFDECTNPKFHDCSENAQCFNLKGTYTCSCKEGFADLSENILYPGRICSAEQIGCERCNYHGTCYSRGDDQYFCECFHWYAGESCHVNLKVLLIALVTLGAILFALLLACIIMTCCRKKPSKTRITTGMSFLPQRVGNRSTMDRRAMIQDTSSEDSRSETNPPYVPKKKKLKGALKKSSVQHNDVENGELSFADQKDRSLTVMIPRAKYHPAPPTSPLINYTTFDARKPSVPSTSNEAKLLSYLDAGPSPNKSDNKRKYSNAPSDSYIEEKPNSRKTSGALVSAGFEVSATVLGNNMGTLGTTCGTEADRSENATLIQKISADLLSSTGTRSQFNTLRDNDIDPMTNWLDITPRINTVSEARSYDETTIPPPMKSFRGDYDSKPSSQHQNDEANTMAERDLGSTFLLPHTHLYKPDRGSDISGFESL
ncbi:mucin-17, partial [Asbolus verrucosus]